MSEAPENAARPFGGGPSASEAAVEEVIAAAQDFVATTSVFRQRKESRDEFTRLAVALIELGRAE